MSDANKVLWSEGLFLRAQHFQQQDRHAEGLMRGALRAGRLQTYLGNYSDAQRQKARARLPESAETAKRSVVDVPKPVAAPQSREPKRTGGESTTRLQRKLEGIEREIGKLEGKLNELSDAIAIAGLGTDLNALTKLSEEYAAAHLKVCQRLVRISESEC